MRGQYLTGNVEAHVRGAKLYMVIVLCLFIKIYMHHFILILPVPVPYIVCKNFIKISTRDAQRYSRLTYGKHTTTKIQFKV